MEDNDVQRIGNWRKLRILFWKNWILQWNQKVQFLVALFLPLLFLSLIVLLRTLVIPTSMTELRYPPVSISDMKLYQASVLKGNRIMHDNGTLNLPRNVICYTPDNSFNRAIIMATAVRLRLLGWRPYDTAEHMESDLVKHNYLAGVQFEKHVGGQNGSEFPLIFNYSLRFPSELRTMPGPVIDTWRTNDRFPRYDLTGPRNEKDVDGGVPVGYLREGFLPLQHALTMSWLELSTNRSDLPQVQLQRFPYGQFIYDPLLNGLKQLLPFILLLSFIYPCCVVAKYITSEKEEQLKEIMILMGIHNWLHWIAWFVKSYILLMIVVGLVMCLLLIRFYNSVAVLTYTNWLPLLLFLHAYVVASICFCFMLAVFFTKASTAAAVTGIMWFLTYIPFSFATYYYERLELWHKLVLSFLFSNTGLGFGFHVIMSWEDTGEGLQFENLLAPVSADDSLALLYVMFMLTLGSLLYMLICLYVEQIHPGDYGVPRRWNYLCQRRFWNGFVSQSSGNVSTADSLYDQNQGSCERKRRQKLGIQLCELSKRYRNHTAVKNLSLKMYYDEITVLLGHNGAGKTTTIHMLTGIIPPTGGTALINGYDIRTQLGLARRSMGICPQRNVLFKSMSVRNHIVFFGSLKGVRGKASLKCEVDKYISMMELEEKSHTTAEKLSGGMKRKLALCCALCGGTRVVLCDEPSSGIDAAARRRLWDLLQAEKAGRTILLTTHYMDEADVLGDRIAILCEGQLQCYGSPFDLKKRYGSGYRLVCVKQNECDSREVTALIAKHIPGIEPESEVGAELAYRLPKEFSNKYANLLSDLEQQSEELKLSGFGLSVATMEDVFVQVTDEYDQKAKRQQGGYSNGDSSLSKGLVFKASTQERRWPKHCLMRWLGLFRKKALITKAQYFILLLQLIIPIIFMSTTILNSRGGRIYYELPAMHISLKQYPKASVVLEDRGSPLASAYSEHLASYGGKYNLLNTSGQSFEDYVLNASNHHRALVDSQYLAGLTAAEKQLTIWLNNKPLHTAPLALNLLHNALAIQLLGKDSATGVTNAPLPYSPDTLSLRLNKGQRLGAEIAIHLSLIMGFITAFYVLPVIQEQQTRAKLLQYLSGVDAFSYWTSHLVWDYTTFTLSAIVAVCTMGAFQEQGYSTFVDLGRYLSMLLIFGLAALPLSYVISRCFSDSATGFTRTAVGTILSGTGFFVVVLALSFEKFKLKDVADQFTRVCRIFPHFSLASGLHHIHINFNIRRGCEVTAIKRLSPADRCRHVAVCCNIPGYYAWSHPGILPEILYLSLESVCLMTLLILVDAKFCAHIFRKSNSSVRSRGSGGAVDKDGIQKERSFIKNLSSEERSNIPLVVDGLSKRYGKIQAVKDLYFYVAPAECFGLLGINGAGKTSTFRMLTGDARISAGVAYVEGINLKTHLSRVYSKIGYCPQFDALFEDLTGRQNLKMYCLLRGVKRRHIKDISDDLATSFGFSQYMDKKAKHYSGGNKRKLSVAIIVIGNPSVLYLDEPTSGMDPLARRQLWKIVAHIRSAGKSIVLTSHSMEECETLCTRIAIMVGGEFKCIGSAQYLKSTYSKGYVLKIKVKLTRKNYERIQGSSSSSAENILNKSGPVSRVVRVRQKRSEPSSTNEEYNSENSSTQKQPEAKSTRADSHPNVPKQLATSTRDQNTNAYRKHKLKKFIAREISDAVLKEEFKDLLTYNIPFQSLSWSDIFQLMENNREKLYIDDYMIMQTSLEEIFLDFAMRNKE